ncbi:TIGR00341 family protein [Micromonospora sp. DT81.3]|uniref:TIGR00341 family protein n=1 Tax=Actinomycetes TaxID=1760 RepID=UPI003CE7A1EB
MSRMTQSLIPVSQRQPVAVLNDSLDLDHGDVISKRSGFLIMLTLSAVIAIAGILTDSTATVIGAMIIAPLATPIQGIGLGIVTGHLSLVVRSIFWVVAGMLIVIVLGVVFSAVIADPASLSTNSQITSRTAPGLLDLLAAIATGTAGAFALARRDLSAVLPGVAIAISLVPPLGVVGVTLGQGDWNGAFGSLMLFLSNLVALVIAASIVFTMSGYAREPDSLPTANRRRAYTVVGVLALLVTIPLAANSVVAVALARWSVEISDSTAEWLGDDSEASVDDVQWQGLTAVVDVTAPDGDVPSVDELRDILNLPSFVTVVLEIDEGSKIPVT